MNPPQIHIKTQAYKWMDLTAAGLKRYLPPEIPVRSVES